MPIVRAPAVLALQVVVCEGLEVETLGHIEVIFALDLASEAARDCIFGRSKVESHIAQSHGVFVNKHGAARILLSCLFSIVVADPARILILLWDFCEDAAASPDKGWHVPPHLLEEDVAVVALAVVLCVSLV